MAGEPITVYGDGMQTRDFIYVTDTAEAVVQVARSKKTRGLVLNVASGEEVAMIDLLNMIAEAMEYREPFKHVEARPGDVRRHIAGVELIKELIGFEPHVGIEEGIKTTVEWYQSNMKP